MTDTERRKAESRVKAFRGFYLNVISFVAVNILLFIVNIVTSPNSLWFYWVTIFWGIGLLFHAIDTFTMRNKYLGDEWEEKKINEIMEKDKKKKAG